MRDTAGKTRVALAVRQGDTPALALLDAMGNVRAGLHEGSLYLWDAAGKVRAAVILSKHGTPILYFRDDNEHVRAMLWATSLDDKKPEEARLHSHSALVLFDKDGKAVWKAP